MYVPHPGRFAADVRRLTEDAYDSGLYCAEAVVSALATAQGVDAGMVTRCATAFCGGMAQTCGQCGALSGAIMGLSLSLGRSDPREPASPAYAATRELVRRFEAEFGGRHCDQLLGCDIGTPEGKARFERQALHTRCERYTARAAEIAAELLTRPDSA